METESMKEQVKIVFQLQPDDRQGFETEKVWAEPVAPNEFRLLNSPFFVFGVSADDVVEAGLQQGTYEFERVVRKGGHSTYRIFLQAGRIIGDESFQLLWNGIRQLGATFENANDHLLSVDVPPHVDVVGVYALLKKGEADGVWAFEEGNYEGADQA
jgi:hypothetical protein